MKAICRDCNKLCDLVVPDSQSLGWVSRCCGSGYTRNIMYLHQLKIHPEARLMERAMKIIEPTAETLAQHGIEGSRRYKIPTDAVGYDIFAPADGFLDPLTSKTVPLGFATSFTPGCIAKYFDRSSMGKKGITVFAGVIDPDFRGEWKVILYNSSPEVFRWSAGDRLVQAVFWKVEVDFEATWVTALEDTFRGAGEFGSTGK